MLGRIFASLWFGTPLAVDPTFRALLKQEREAQAAHREVRSIRQAKTERLHSALAGGRR